MGKGVCRHMCHVNTSTVYLVSGASPLSNRVSVRRLAKVVDTRMMGVVTVNANLLINQRGS